MAPPVEDFLRELTLEEAVAVLRASASILRMEEFETVAQRVFQAMKGQIGARAGHVSLVSDDGRENGVVFLDDGERGRGADLVSPAPMRELRARVLETGRALYVNDLRPSGGEAPDDGIRPESLLIAPLTIEGEVRGLLTLAGKEGGFTSHDASLAEHFGHLAALALQNSYRKSELEASESRCRHIIEGAFDAMVSIGEDDRVIFLNDAFRRLISIPDERILGRDVEEVLRGAEIPQDEGIHRLSAVLPDGRQLSMEVSMSRSVMKGESVRIVVIRDISSKEQLKRQVRLANRKTELMGRITRHDVLNHITVVQGFLDLSYDSGQPLSQKHFERISEALERMKSLYSLQRDFEALGTAVSEWVSVRRAFESARSMLAQDSSAVSFRIETDGEVWADPLFEKALYNLLDNSLRHGGSLTEIGISAAREGEEALLEVWDDGTGVPERDKGSIFKLGFGKNSGQGLFLVQEILGAYGMCVEEVGVPGEGARFRIRMPASSWREG